MGDWALASGSRIEVVGAVTGSTGGTTVTAAGSANTKGSWAQLVAATPCAASSLIVTGNFTGGIAHLLDIGVGASGSETVLVPDIHASCVSNNPIVVSFPIAIPAGARLAARLAASTASSTMSVIAYLAKGGWPEPTARSLVDTYGAAAATSRGASVDPGSTANTKGSWTQITASTTRRISTLVVGVGNQRNTAPTAGAWFADIGIGASGSETVLIPNHRIVASANGSLLPSHSLFPVSIPAGSRLAVRAQSGITDATDRLIDFLLHGVC